MQYKQRSNQYNDTNDTNTNSTTMSITLRHQTTKQKRPRAARRQDRPCQLEEEQQLQTTK